MVFSKLGSVLTLVHTSILGMHNDILFVQTSDNLRLQGVCYLSGKTNTCVLFVHGMSGNFIENYFAHVVGEALAKNGIDFIYSHNRGYNHVNDIATTEIAPNGGYKTVRIGARYERFEECLIDIDCWLKEVVDQGYEKIILCGHSLGCNKVIYYFSQKLPSKIAAVILISPPDMVGLFEKPEYQPDHNELLVEAKSNVTNNNPRKILSRMIWDWYNLSSQTYVDLSQTFGPVDNLPLLRNPPRFEQLETINVPILATMGEYDDIAIRNLKEDMKLIASKATNCPSFEQVFIEKANHTYDIQEAKLAGEILKWIKQLKF